MHTMPFVLWFAQQKSESLQGDENTAYLLFFLFRYKKVDFDAQSLVILARLGLE